MSVISSLIPTIIANPPTNPGYLASVASPLNIVDTSGTTQSIYNLASSVTKTPWIIAFNFNTHSLVANGGKYITAVAYVTITGPDNKLVSVTNSLYNNRVGVCLQGGTVGNSYTLTVAGTLNDSTSVSYSLVINIQ